MLKQTVSFLILFILTTCGGSQSYEMAEDFEENENRIVFIDSISNDLKKDTSTSLKEADFHPLYIGKKTDSIHLNYNPKKMEFECVTTQWGRFKTPDSSDLNISVDTNALIASVQHYIDWVAADSLSELYPALYTMHYQSYPVIIENLTKDTLEIGYGEYVPLIIEARDETGEWKSIQRPFVYGCGTGMPFYFLPPGEILITSCKLFDGEFKTTMRLAFGWESKTYSNEFAGYINRGQFDYSRKSYY